MAGNPLNLAYPSNLGPGNPYVEPRHYRSLVDNIGDLQLVTPPSGLPLLLADAKLHLRETSADQDSVITGLIYEAAAYVEDNIDGQRQLLTATFDAPVRGWWHGELHVPRPPLVSVTSVKYYDTSGTLQTWASSNYIVTTPWRGPGRIERAPNVVYPSVQPDRRYPIVVRFVCGYGAAADLPVQAIHAMKLIIGHRWRFRGDDDEQGRTSQLEVPPAAENLLRSLGWGAYV